MFWYCNVICNLKCMQIVLKFDFYLSDRGYFVMDQSCARQSDTEIQWDLNGLSWWERDSSHLRLGLGGPVRQSDKLSWVSPDNGADRSKTRNQHFHQLRIRKSDCYLTLRILEICTISWNIKKLISFTDNNIPPATQPVFELIIQIFIAFNSYLRRLFSV